MHSAIDTGAVYPSITLDLCKSILKYDRHTGRLTWRTNRGRNARIGDEAGVVDPKNGYVMITVKGRKIMAHRLVWFMTYGKWPEGRLRARGERDDLAINNWEEERFVVKQTPTARSNRASYLRHSAGLTRQWLLQNGTPEEKRIAMTADITTLSVQPSVLAELAARKARRSH